MRDVFLLKNCLFSILTNPVFYYHCYGLQVKRQKAFTRVQSEGLTVSTRELCSCLTTQHQQFIYLYFGDELFDAFFICVTAADEFAFYGHLTSFV